jgi:hypothetical protein
MKTRLEHLDDALTDANVTPDPASTTDTTRIWTTDDGRTRIGVTVPDAHGRLIVLVGTQYAERVHERLKFRHHDWERVVAVLAAAQIIEFPYEPDPLPAELAKVQDELERERERADHAEQAHDELLRAADETHHRMVMAEADLEAAERRAEKAEAGR